MTGEGTLIGGRYRLGAEIGSGAMGVVWQASDERLHRTVALKQLLLPAGLSIKDAAAARARVMREGRIAARLQHPGTISIYDVIEHDTQPWLVMEYLPSRSLAAWLAEHGPLRPEDAALMGTAVATALAAAHSAGVVHRDVKPGNILLGEDGSVKITDFGISRANGDVTLTATGVLAGTPGYLSPEMARGEPPAPASDVFSLGSTLYAAVEGRAPFAGPENQLAVLHAVAAGEFEPPRRAGRLTALLMRLLRSDPAQRPTMAQAAHALAEIAEGRTVPTAALVPGAPGVPEVPPAIPLSEVDGSTIPQVLPAGAAFNTPPAESPVAAASNGTAATAFTPDTYRELDPPTAPRADQVGTRQLQPTTPPAGTPPVPPTTPTPPPTPPRAQLPAQQPHRPADPWPPRRDSRTLLSAPDRPEPRGQAHAGARAELAPWRPSPREILYAVLAVLVAVGVGIGVASLLMSIG